MKKKGFTLIELLAVIVVLAIIALIVTPVISKIIEGAKQRSSVTSAQNYIDSVNNVYALSMIDSNYEYLKEKEVLESGFDDNELAEVQINGKKPSYIKIEYDKSKNRVKEGKFCVDGTSVDYINGVATKSENDYCHKEVVAGLYDKDNNLIISWEDMKNNYKLDMLYNKTLRDNYSTMYRYNADEDKFYHWVDGKAVYDVDDSEITMLSPQIVFDKYKLSGQKLVVSNELGEVPRFAFDGFKYKMDIIIPAGITKIGGASFNNSDITSVTFGPDVTRIDGDSFDFTTNLKTFIIPDTVTEFGGNDFDSPDFIYGVLSMSNVEKIVIGKGVTIIPQSFCIACTKLKSIEIPSNVKEIRREAFAGNTISVSSIVLHEGIEKIGEFAFRNITAPSLKIPNSVTELGNNAFEGAKIPIVEIGTGLTEIPDYAFSYAKIETLKIPDNIKKIGNFAFQNNILTTLDLGHGVEEIDSYAFAHCNYENLVVPASVKKIGRDAFYHSDYYGPSPLKTLTFENTNYWTNDGTCTALTLSNATTNASEFTDGHSALNYYSSLSECQ